KNGENGEEEEEEGCAVVSSFSGDGATEVEVWRLHVRRGSGGCCLVKETDAMSFPAREENRGLGFGWRSWCVAGKNERRERGLAAVRPVEREEGGCSPVTGKKPKGGRVVIVLSVLMVVWPAMEMGDGGDDGEREIGEEAA
ncbi:hypothetical protein HAX54_017293, partial [Datura stramonium]|nr:hypothetical protein [Datura stramonium]